MKVLHFITSIDSADIYPAEYMSALLRCMGMQAEVHLASFHTAGATPIEHAQVHLFDYPKHMADSSFNRGFDRMLTELSPEIIHIHGCWDRTLWDAVRLSSGHDIPVVLSPHGALEPTVMQTFFLTRRLPRLVAYQYRTLLKADVVLSSTDSEEESLKSMLWNQRITIIPDPRLVPDVSYEQVSNQLLALYRKTIDTTCSYHALDHEAQEAVKTLLREGTATNQDQVSTPEETAETLRQMPLHTWRKLLIIAHDNHLEQIYNHAFDRLGIAHPDIDVSQIDRFDRTAKGIPATLPDDTLLHATPFTKSKLGNISDPVVKRIAVMLLNIQHLVHTGDILLGHLAQLYTTLRYENYDEDIFAQAMKSLRTKTFAEKTELLLHYFFGLTEGFMPIPACKPQQARTLIKQTIKSL